MSDASDSTRNDTLARLAQSRAEIRRVLEPPPRIHHDSADGIPDGDDGGEFPRSRTMRLLLTGRGIGTVGAVVGGFAHVTSGVGVSAATNAADRSRCSHDDNQGYQRNSIQAALTVGLSRA